MKLKETIDVVVKSEDGDVIAKFKKEKLNEALQRDLDISKLENTTDQAKAWIDRIVNNLLSIEGLTNEQGEAVGVEEIKSLNVPQDFIMLLVTAFQKAKNPELGEEEKKSLAILSA